MEGNAILNLSPVSQLSIAGSTVSPGNDLVLDPHSCLQLEDTLRRGKVLDIVRPFWCKVTESEQRLAWLETMVRKELVVRDLDGYTKSIGACLRSEEYKMREEERIILLEVMRLKVKDEKKHLVYVRRKREEVRRKLIDIMSKGRTSWG